MKDKVLIAKLVRLGDDLVASITNANWGTIRHPTMHMQDAIAVWKQELADHKIEQKKGEQNV